MDTQKAPVNYLGNGRWYFEAELKSGHYQLEITPHLFIYELRLPSGKTVEGSIPALITRIENDHSDPELTDWLENALAWDYRNSGYKEWRKRKSFILDNRKYTVEINPRTGEISIEFPALILVTSRERVTHDYPEIHSIKKGALHETLLDVIEEVGIQSSFKNKSAVHKTPILQTNITEFLIDNWTVWIGYDNLRDLVFLHQDSRKVNSHVNTLTIDVWELEALHQGRFKDKIIDILTLNGMQLG